MSALQLVADIHDLCNQDYFSDARYAHRRRALVLLIKAEQEMMKLYDENVRLQNEVEVLRRHLLKEK